ncbi:MAG: hypothetical protein JKY48_19635 [Flavobacteriales bacterium]|nr:hypothetical protein [Flavobacteriales bacterium]
MFHRILISYINSGGFSKSDFFLGLIFPFLVFQKNSKRLMYLFRQEKDFEIDSSTKLSVQVELYQGTNPYVKKMMAQLKGELKEDLFGAYLHGSLATQEEILYSDFDALVILNDTVFENEKRLSKVALKLNRLQKNMYDFDPLQHHGWFVLTESMLKNYPTAYFPIELFKHSVSLLTSEGLRFDISYDSNEIDFETPFLQLSNELLKKVQYNYRPKNSFALKSFLSEFMLLPSFYLQLKNKKAIYKKESFELARKDFSDKEWNIMDQVSEIRKEWNYEISVTQRNLLCHNNSVVRKLSRKFAPEILNSIAEKLTDEFYAAMSSLVLSMQTNVKSL